MEEELDYILEYKFIAGFRQSSKLLYVEKEEQIYKYKSRKEHLKYYYCYKKDCKAGVSVESNGNNKYCRRIGKTNVHNHGSQMELYKKLEIMNNIKMEVKNATMKRTSIRDIFEQNCKKFQDASHLLEYDKMRRQLFNIKKEQLPKSPNNFAELMLALQNEKVFRQFGISKYEKEETQPFYIDTVITDTFSYSVFISPTIAKDLRTKNSTVPQNYIIDCLFSFLPQLPAFEKLLIISTLQADHAYPFIYVLMSNTSEAAYTHLLQYLKSQLLSLQGSKVISDFDWNLRNALKSVYPAVQLVECWFHYINALRRKAVEIPNFVDQLNQDQQAGHLFNKFLYLPLLKPRDLLAAHEILKEESLNYFKPFLKYYDFEWLQKIKAENFSVYGQPMRTNNTLESLQSRLNMKNTKHPNMFKFLQILCDFDCETSTNYVKQLNQIVKAESSHESFFKNRDKFIQEWLRHLEEGKISLSEALNQFSYSNKITISKCFLKKFNITNTGAGEPATTPLENVLVNEPIVSIEVDTCKDDKSQIQKCLLCIICNERERQLLFFPCRHFKVCQHCFDQMSEKSKVTNTQPLCTSCPLEVVSVLPIFCFLVRTQNLISNLWVSFHSTSSHYFGGKTKTVKLHNL